MDMHQEMRHEILRYLEKNSRVNLQELAVLLGVDETLVAMRSQIWKGKDHLRIPHSDRLGQDRRGEVTALIEVRVTPQRIRDLTGSRSGSTIIRKSVPSI